MTVKLLQCISPVGTKRTCRDVRFKSVMRSIVLQKSFCRSFQISKGQRRVVSVDDSE